MTADLAQTTKTGQFEAAGGFQPDRATASCGPANT
jgi:hypothetical protein